MHTKIRKTGDYEPYLTRMYSTGSDSHSSSSSSLWHISGNTMSWISTWQIRNTHVRVRLTLLLKSLHSLPVRQHVIYKLATVCYKTRSTSTPAYLQSLLLPHVPSRSLRLSHAPRLAVPRTRTVFASRAFSVAAPTVWNSLPDNVVNSDTTWQLSKSDWKLTFSLRHVKRSCQRVPLHFLVWCYTSLPLYCIVCTQRCICSLQWKCHKPRIMHPKKLETCHTYGWQQLL